MTTSAGREPAAPGGSINWPARVVAALVKAVRVSRSASNGQVVVPPSASRTVTACPAQATGAWASIVPRRPSRNR
jgi:hypothetical protein